MQVEDAAQQQLVAELQAENRRLQVPCTAGMSASHATYGDPSGITRLFLR